MSSNDLFFSEKELGDLTRAMAAKPSIEQPIPLPPEAFDPLEVPQVQEVHEPQDVFQSTAADGEDDYLLVGRLLRSWSVAAPPQCAAKVEA